MGLFESFGTIGSHQAGRLSGQALQAPTIGCMVVHFRSIVNVDAVSAAIIIDNVEESVLLYSPLGDPEGDLGCGVDLVIWIFVVSQTLREPLSKFRLPITPPIP